MKKAKSELNDWMRPEYKRSDLGRLVRGKYAKQISQGTIMVVLDQEVAEAFPDAKAVNDALRSLIPRGRSAAPTRRKGSSKKVLPKRRVA